MDALLEWAKVILSFIGPILVVYVTVRGERSKKAEEAIKKLEQQDTESKRKELADSVSEISTRLKELEESISTMDVRINKIEVFGRETRDDVKKLSDHYAINAQSTRELAQLVMVMGEGLRDQHLDGNITQAITRYRRYEKEALDRFMTIPPDVDND